MTDPPILSETPALVRLAAELERERAIGVDLEADSMYSYREKVCLLQFSTPSRTVVVDPLVITDLAPLQPVMANPRIRKIFHAADYDVRCLFRDFHIEVRGLFDTMVCGQFLGEAKVGLADMLNKYFGLQLNKKYQRADWSARPLRKAMVRYAAEDTRHLHRLAERLIKRLDDKGRRTWVDEEFLLLEQVRHNYTDGPLFLRIKGARNLSRRQLAALEALLAWRNCEAQRRDCPLFKVISNNALLAMAGAMPTNVKTLATIKGLSPSLKERSGKTLVRVIGTALAMPEEQLPVYPVPEKPATDRQADARLRKLKNWRTRKAAQLAIDPGVLINNSLLEAIARRPPVNPAALAAFSNMKNWQRRELGPEIVATLQ
jgi:ribonuclease D